MKRLVFLSCTIFLLFGMVGCSKEASSSSDSIVQESTSSEIVEEKQETEEKVDKTGKTKEEKKQEQREKKAKEEQEKAEKEALEFVSNQDEKQHILEDLAVKDAKVPEVMLTGNRWTNFDENEVKNLWKFYYPYMEVVFGPIADDFWEQGLTWNMSDDTMLLRCCEQHPETNSIDMGTPGVDTDFRQCAYSLVHETGHLWLQNLNDGINFDCGQWLWEANTLLFERIAEMEILDPEHRSNRMLPTGFDLINFAGPDIINGVYTDGDKASRSVSDQSGTDALYLLDTALSTPGTYDYWRNVSIERTKYCKENNVSLTPPDVLGEIMDRVADGKTMDGMKPSEWLFSRSVANTSGAEGNFLAVFGRYDNLPNDTTPNSEWPSGVGQRTDVSISCFSRMNGRESSLTGTEVEVNVYDSIGIKKATGKAVIPETSVAELSFIDNNGNELGLDAFTEYSVIRYVATATIDGVEYSDTNYQIVTPPGDFVGEDDTRLFFILLNEDETVDTKEIYLDIQGGLKVDKTHMNRGLIIVNVKQGEDITINGQTFTKPRGARVIPIYPKKDK